MTDFGEVRYRVAKKVHRCEWCGESIQVKESHAHFAGKWEGEFQNWRMHRECYTEANDNHEIEDGFMPYEHERPLPPCALTGTSQVNPQ